MVLDNPTVYEIGQLIGKRLSVVYLVAHSNSYEAVQDPNVVLLSVETIFETDENGDDVADFSVILVNQDPAVHRIFLKNILKVEVLPPE